MGTFSKPGLTRGEERLVDRSGIAINQAIQTLGASFESQVAMINLNKKAALEQQMQVYKQAGEIDSSDASLGNNLAQALRLQADDLYKTTINTMGEDQTEALRKESNLIGSVENLGGNLEVINITAKKLQKMRQEGKSGLVSMNSNPKFLEFYSNIALYGGAGSKVNGVEAVESRIENGNIILSQKNSDGEIVEFSMQGNANAMANGGAPHVSFVDSEAIIGGYKTNWTGLTKDIPALVKQTEALNKSKGITTSVDKIYEQQSSIAFEKMKNNKAEIALNSSDDFQLLTFTGNYKAGPEDTLDKDGNVLFTGSQEQREKIQLAKAEYAQQQFSNQNVRTKITEELPPPAKPTKPKNQKGKVDVKTKLNHTKFIDTLAGLENKIDIVETPTGLPPKIPTDQAGRDAMKGKVYRNEVEFTKNAEGDKINNPDFTDTYRFDGEKYIKIDPEKDDIQDLDKLKVQKLADIKKYLLKAKTGPKVLGIVKGDNREITKEDEIIPPGEIIKDGIYRKTGGGYKEATTYTLIDIENEFDQSILDDLDGMENKLNQALGINPI